MSEALSGDHSVFSSQSPFLTQEYQHPQTAHCGASIGTMSSASSSTRSSSISSSTSLTWQTRLQGEQMTRDPGDRPPNTRLTIMSLQENAKDWDIHLPDMKCSRTEEVSILTIHSLIASSRRYHGYPLSFSNASSGLGNSSGGLGNCLTSRVTFEHESWTDASLQAEELLGLVQSKSMARRTMLGTGTTGRMRTMQRKTQPKSRCNAWVLFRHQEVPTSHHLVMEVSNDHDATIDAFAVFSRTFVSCWPFRPCNNISVYTHQCIVHADNAFDC